MWWKIKNKYTNEVNISSNKAKNSASTVVENGWSNSKPVDIRMLGIIFQVDIAKNIDS